MEVVDLGFTRLEFRPGYVVVRTVEGADIDLAQHRQVIAAIEQRIDGNYGFLLDEVNSYSVRLGVMVDVRQNPRLKCLAIVAYRGATRMLAGMVAGTIEKPFEVFPALEQASAWMEEQLAV